MPTRAYLGAMVFAVLVPPLQLQRKPGMLSRLLGAFWARLGSKQEGPLGRFPREWWIDGELGTGGGIGWRGGCVESATATGQGLGEQHTTSKREGETAESQGDLDLT